MKELSIIYQRKKEHNSKIRLRKKIGSYWRGGECEGGGGLGVYLAGRFPFLEKEEGEKSTTMDNNFQQQGETAFSLCPGCDT